MRLKGKVALITGAGSGIGRAIAVRFAEEGARIAIHDVNAKGADATARLVEDVGSSARCYEVDVAIADQVRSAVARTVAEYGAVDVLVNDAGVNLYREPFDFTDADWEWIIGVNLTGTWNYCREVGAHMIENGSGAIVNVASVGAFQASYYRVPYMASKGAVGMLTRALAIDMGDKGIRVNAVGPGPVQTEMTRPMEGRLGVLTDEVVYNAVPMRRWGQPREVANAALFLASDEASYITGHILVVDGGLLAGNPVGREWEKLP